MDGRNGEIAEELICDSDSNDEEGNENRPPKTKGKKQADENKVIERSQRKLMDDILNGDPRVPAEKLNRYPGYWAVSVVEHFENGW